MRDPAFDGFFLSEYPAVLRTVEMLLNDREAAEDVCQEAFYRVYVHWGRVSGYDKPGAFARRVAIRLAGKAARRMPPPSAAPSPVGEPPLHDVHAAVASLPAMQRASVVLHYFDDRSVAEVASILGRSQGSVKTHLHRARKKLAALLAEEDSDVSG